MANTNTFKLTQALVPVVRRKMFAEAGNRCTLCRRQPEDKQLVLDHCHKTGHVRATLCRGCNSMLGHIENNMPRHMLTDLDVLRVYLSNVVAYISADYSHQPLYPSHKNSAEKKAASYEKQRKKLIKERVASNPTQAEAIKAKEKALRTARANRNRPTVKSSQDI